MIPLLCIPILNRGDLLTRFIESIDAPVANLLIINNGWDDSVLEALDELSRLGNRWVGDVRVLTPGRNLGVAASLNTGLRMMAGEGLAFCVFSGNDIELAPGDLAKLAAAHDPALPVRTSLHGFSLSMMDRSVPERIGYLDENFYPAYHEDFDLMRRLDLMGIPYPRVEGIGATHGDEKHACSLTIRSDPEMFRANNFTHATNRDYYVSKWGGLRGSERFRHPFNDPSRPVSWWEHDLDHLRSNSIWPAA
jgi:GT2 family glycosyltransferase